MQDLLRHFVEVLDALANRETEDGQISGTYTLTPERLPIIAELADNDLITEPILFRGNHEFIDNIGFEEGDHDEVELTLIPSNLARHGCSYFETYADLIGRHPYESPENPFYLREANFFSEDAQPPVKHTRYEETTRLISLLRSISDHDESGPQATRRLFFYEGGKLILETRYTDDDLRNLEGLDSLCTDLIGQDDTQSQREAIFRGTLVDALTNIPVESRFSYLLDSFEIVHARYVDSFRRFVQNFSYEKMRSEFEKDRVTFIHRLNQTVSAIGTKVVSIPIAFLLVAGQIEPVEEFTLKNTIILCGAFMFSILLSILIENQKSALLTVKEEIDQLKSTMVALPSDKEDPINKGFTSLEGLHGKQKFRLNAIQFVVWLVFIAALGLYCYYSPLRTVVSNFFS